MSDRLDRALAVIDVGLQRAGDVSYGSDNGLCVRCQLLPATVGSSWCANCPPARPSEADLAALAALAPRLMEMLVPVITETVQRIEYLAEACAPTLAQLVELKRKMDEADPRDRAVARKHRPFTCHRHGVQAGGFCRPCSRQQRS
jgi:hypothetical protein